jgi:translation elongation factor EF-1beta
MDDLFGDDDEDDAEAAALAKAKKEQATAKKVGPITKSIVVFEVKPWELETNLDELAKKILDIKMDGLVWKTETKKEPVAYGIFKLIIGCVVEDEKVSTDDLEEQIMGFEDDVQSVNIISFNKV